MVRVDFKSCPRCGGDLIHDRYTADDHETYCIQCSYRPPTVSNQPDERYEKYMELRKLSGVNGQSFSVNG